MRMMNPSLIVFPFGKVPKGPLDWISWFSNLRRLELFFVDSPRVFWNIGLFIEQTVGPGGTRVGTTHQGAPGPPGAPCWIVPPLGHPQGAARARCVPSGP